MNTADHQRFNEKVRNAIAKLKGVEFRGPEDLAEFLKNEGVSFSARDLTAFGYILATRFGRNYGALHVPDWLADAFSGLIEGVSSQTICDPWAGIGVLIGVLREVSRANLAIAITPSEGEHTLGAVLVPEVAWQVGDPLQLLGESHTELDVAASILPFGGRPTRPLKLTLPSGASVELADDLGNLILVAASMRLRSSGVGLFVVPPSFFFLRQSVFRQFGEIGLGVEAALALPSGTFAPYTNISAYLLVVRRKPSSRMFVAQLSADAKTNRQIIGNLRRETEGGSLDLGRFVDAGSFQSIEHLRVSEVLTLAEKRFGVQAVNLAELADVKSGIKLGRPGDEFTFRPLESAIYIPLIGNSDVLESPDQLTLKAQNYAQVIIDPTRSNAGFVARFLNSDFGKQLRDQNRTGVIPRLKTQGLRELRVLVPDLQTQQRVLETENGIIAQQSTVMALQNELAELRRELWANPNTAPSVQQRLGGLASRLAGGIQQHASEALDLWFETLPFPLASILRAWQATPSQDFKTKYEHLLHFFEATAEFVSVILLSAYSSNDAVFEPHRQNLTDAMQKQNLSFKRATFGTWKLVLEQAKASLLGEEIS